MRTWIAAGLAAAAVPIFAWAATGPASAQGGLSEKSVRTLMEYAWALTPDRFTKPDGVTITVDRNKRGQVEVPLDTAREVIRVGRLSSHAQMCDLPEDQRDNYRSLMIREAKKKKWSEQQMLYMNQLHLVTVMLLTGKLKLIEREEGKEPKVIEDGKKTEVKSCTPEQKEKVKQAILAYVKSGPPLPVISTAAGGPAPAGAAASATPAAAKK